MASNCLLCGSASTTKLHRGTDRLYATTSVDFDVVRCDSCGLVRLDPQPPAEELHKYYPQQYWFAPKLTLAGRLEELYRKMMIRDHVAFARGAVQGKADARVLDVGCGGGLFLRELRTDAMRVFGLDVSVEAARTAEAQNAVHVAVGDLRRAPFVAGQWDLITMYHVLEHVHDPREFLRAARELLAPQGRLIAQVPNIDCLQYRMLGGKWSGLDIPRHLHEFRTSDMVRMMEACGFVVERVKHFSWRDNPAGLATSLLPSLDPVARVIRKLDSGPVSKLCKDLAYFGVMIACIPFAAFESALGRGSSVMLQARAAE